MSDNDTTAVTNGTATPFNERELQLLCWAMQSLKSGPPEIDYEKLAAFAGMGNPRSASNAWAKIKTKLMAGTDGNALATPKKGGAKKAAAKKTGKDGEETPKKAAAKKPTTKDADEDGETTPKKTPRKRTAKKQDVDGETSPAKKPRGRPRKAVAEAENKKAEDDKAEDDKAEKSDSPAVKPEADAAENSDEAAAEDEV